jgi:hypothetical protein
VPMLAGRAPMIDAAYRADAKAVDDASAFAR